MALNNSVPSCTCIFSLNCEMACLFWKKHSGSDIDQSKSSPKMAWSLSQCSFLESSPPCCEAAQAAQWRSQKPPSEFPIKTPDDSKPSSIPAIPARRLLHAEPPDNCNHPSTTADTMKQKDLPLNTQNCAIMKWCFVTKFWGGVLHFYK